MDETKVEMIKIKESEYDKLVKANNQNIYFKGFADGVLSTGLGIGIGVGLFATGYGLYVGGKAIVRALSGKKNVVVIKEESNGDKEL